MIGLQIDFRNQKFIILDENPVENEVFLGKITPLFTHFQHFLTGNAAGVWHTWDPKAMQPCKIH